MSLVRDALMKAEESFFVKALTPIEFEYLNYIKMRIKITRKLLKIGRLLSASCDINVNSNKGELGVFCSAIKTHIPLTDNW